jgi:signal transduction histidine kinase
MNVLFIVVLFCNVAYQTNFIMEENIFYLVLSLLISIIVIIATKGGFLRETLFYQAVSEYWHSIKEHSGKYLFLIFMALFVYSSDYFPIQLMGTFGNNNLDKTVLLEHPDYLFAANFKDKSHWSEKLEKIDFNKDKWKNFETKLDSIKHYTACRNSGDSFICTFNNSIDNNEVLILKNDSLLKETYVDTLFMYNEKEQKLWYRYPVKQSTKSNTPDKESSLIFAFLTTVIGLSIGFLSQVVYRILNKFEETRKKKEEETPVFLLFGVSALLFAYMGSISFYHFSSLYNVNSFFHISLNNVYESTSLSWILIIISIPLFFYVCLRIPEEYKKLKEKKDSAYENFTQLLKEYQDLKWYLGAAFLLLISVGFGYKFDWKIDLLGYRQFPEMIQCIALVFGMQAITQKLDETKYRAKAKDLYKEIFFEQIDAHAFNNTITDISYIIKDTHNTQEAHQWLINLSDFTGHLLGNINSAKNTISNNSSSENDKKYEATLYEEIQFLKRLIIFHCIRLNEKAPRIQFSTGEPYQQVEYNLAEIEKKLPEEWKSIDIPRLILLEPLQNALKYTKVNGVISIRCIYNAPVLTFSVQNQYDLDKINNHVGYSTKRGIDFTQETLDAFYSKKNSTFITVQNKDGMYDSKITINDVHDRIKLKN